MKGKARVVGSAAGEFEGNDVQTQMKVHAMRLPTMVIPLFIATIANRKIQ